YIVIRLRCVYHFIPIATSVLMLFFFQAEDGIRARNVTGVQTCALPISLISRVSVVLPQPDSPQSRMVSPSRIVRLIWLRLFSFRSEERREGKSVDVGGGGASTEKKTHRA